MSGELRQFRLLYRHFLFRVVDLEALSAKADTVRLLGQFGSVLLMFSLIQGLVALQFGSAHLAPAQRLNATWSIENQLIALTLLVAGVFSVLSWDAMLPDCRDILILDQLPVRSGVLLAAKVAAAASAVGLAVLALNCVSGLLWPLALAGDGFLALARCYAAYWFTMLAASAFLFAALLSLHALSALLLPRGLFLKVSGSVQVFGIAAILGEFFLEPAVGWPTALLQPANHQAAVSFPIFWFLALFNRLQGNVDPVLVGLADRAIYALLAVLGSAAVLLVLAGLKLVRRISEQPELRSNPKWRRWMPHLAPSSTRALVLFIGRSLARSRQHRLVVAFYLGVGFALTLATSEIAIPQQGLASQPNSLLSMRYLIGTIIMMIFAVVGVRVAFSLPLTLPANWLFRITEGADTTRYQTAGRAALLLLAVVPVWFGSALFAVVFEPFISSSAYLVVLFLLGFAFAQLSLFSFPTVPFTRSYLPGKANVQFLFWVAAFAGIPLVDLFAHFEQQVLGSPVGLAVMPASLCILNFALAQAGKARGRASSLSSSPQETSR